MSTMEKPKSQIRRAQDNFAIPPQAELYYMCAICNFEEVQRDRFPCRGCFRSSGNVDMWVLRGIVGAPLSVACDECFAKTGCDGSCLPEPRGEIIAVQDTFKPWYERLWDWLSTYNPGDWILYVFNIVWFVVWLIVIFK